MIEMKIEDKIKLCSGKDFWHTKSFEEYGLASFMVADGPNGVRRQTESADNLGINESAIATAFPTSSITACSFDEELLEQVGNTIGLEALAGGVKVVLGPGCNIKRNPLCGRNFEYFSEDPLLSGKMAASFIKGVQKSGANSCVKHFAFNNQEYKRFSSISYLDEKTAREIYLKPFEIAVKEGKVACVMSSYNLYNGIHTSENKWLLTDVLRDEWGFDGLVLTDWGGMSNRSASFEAGCDLCMPGGSNFGESKAIKDVKEGKLDVKYIDNSAERIIKLAKKELPHVEVDLEKHHEIALKVAENSMVLLKNEDDILPIKKEEVAYIGYMAKKIRYQGFGSSHINPYKLVNPIEEIEIPFAYGCNEDGSTNDALIEEAKLLAKQKEKVVLFIGLTDKYESEGYDRKDLKLPNGHIRLVNEICTVNNNVIVVLMSGSVVEIPFLDKIKGLLYAGLAGQATATAINNILLGKVNPSGKLAETWGKRYEDYVNSSYYGSKHAYYSEGIYVGYRYFDKARKEVNFPFGYGLSYSKFEYSNLIYENNKLSFRLKNISDVEGKEVVQLYLENPTSYRPIRELKGFKKIHLKPQQEEIVTFEIDAEMFKVFNNGWIIPKGNYKLQIGSSSRDIKLEKEIIVEGIENNYDISNWYYDLNGEVTEDDFKTLYHGEIIEDKLIPGKFSMDNTVLEMKDYSLMMKIMYKAVEKTIAKSNGGKIDYTNPTFKMMISSSVDCSLNGMKICAPMNNNVFEGMLEIANKHFIKGIITMCRKN